MSTTSTTAPSGAPPSASSGVVPPAAGCPARPGSPAAAAPGFGVLRDELQSRLLGGYPELIARLAWDRARIVAHQRVLLRGLLVHAAEHSPFHARRLRGIDLDDVDPTDLSALPVMTKTQMLDELDDVYTDRRLSRAAVEAALAGTRDEPVPLLGEYIAVASGGSSGQRGTFVFDADGLHQFLGSLTRGLVARITQLGGPPPGGLPCAMVAAASPVHPTGLAGPCSAGGRLPFRWHPVPATLPLAEIVRRLEGLRAPVLYGYPTVLARLADERRAGGLRIAPVSVISTSETLTPELRARIADGFGAPIVDAFGSSEGLVGAAPPGDPVVAFAEDGCVVELVDAANRPVPAGAPSAKVLVTNLYNRVQPLIRYELADVLVQEPFAPGHGYLRARVRGRADETFRYPSGNGPIEIDPFVVRTVFVQAPEVAEYRVRQTAGGIDVEAVAAPGLDTALDTDALAGRLAAALAGAGLDRPRVTVRRVDRLARHAETGKLARFVPLR